MASLRKRGKVWYYRVVDADGVKVERKGCADKRATEAMAAHAEAEAAKVRAGLIDPKAIVYLRQAASPLFAHLRDFELFLMGKGDTARHARLYSDRASRLAGLVCGGTLAEIDPGRRAPRADRAGPTPPWHASSRLGPVGRPHSFRGARWLGHLAERRPLAADSQPPPGGDPGLRPVGAEGWAFAG